MCDYSIPKAWTVDVVLACIPKYSSNLKPYDSLAVWFLNDFLILTLLTFWAGYFFFFNMDVIMCIVRYLASMAFTHYLSVIILPTPPWQLKCFQIFQNILWGKNWPSWKPLFQRNVYHSPKYFPLFSYNLPLLCPVLLFLPHFTTTIIIIIIIIVLLNYAI